MSELDEQAIEAAAKAAYDMHAIGNHMHAIGNRFAKIAWADDVPGHLEVDRNRYRAEARASLAAYLTARGPAPSDAQLVEALEAAEDFIERTKQWTGSDPDEVHEVLATIRAVLDRDVDEMACDSSTPEQPHEGAAVETWMVDYEHGDGEPQHAVLSWLDDEAKELPEVGTQLVRRSDYDALLTGPASYEGVVRMLREVQEERDALRLRAVRAEQVSTPELSPTDPRLNLCECGHPESEHWYEHGWSCRDETCRCSELKA